MLFFRNLKIQFSWNGAYYNAEFFVSTLSYVFAASEIQSLARLPYSETRDLKM